MKKDKIIIGVLGVILIILLGVIAYLLTTGAKTYKEITGKVIVASEEYVIIEASDNDYLISNIKGNYDVGDTIKFTYEEKDLDNSTSPKTIKISDEDLVKHNVDNNLEENDNKNQVIDDKNDVNSNSANNSDTNTKPATNNTNTPNNNANNNGDKEITDNNFSNSSNTNADTLVINYFNDYQKEIANTSSSNTKSTLKQGFVTIIDFLFYDGTIKGYTFKDLTSTAKLKVLAMALYFDGKIEEYFPGYKESISSTANKAYTTVKEKVIATYLTITTSICTNNSDTCNSAKEGFKELKNNFGLTWELLKSIAGDGITNLKNWYEIWRES